jgi:hypothetical protein
VAVLGAGSAILVLNDVFNTVSLCGILAPAVTVGSWVSWLAPNAWFVPSRLFFYAPPS